MQEQELIQQLIQIACPGAVVERDKWSPEPHYLISHNGTLIGSLIPEGPEWLVRPWMEKGVSGPETKDGDSAYFGSLTDAIRRLFQLDGPTKVVIDIGVPEDEQESSFQNATLQGFGSDIAFSIAARMELPDWLSQQPEAAIGQYFERQLQKASSVVPGLSFEVQLGKSHDALAAEDE